MPQTCKFTVRAHIHVRFVLCFTVFCEIQDGKKLTKPCNLRYVHIDLTFFLEISRKQKKITKPSVLRYVQLDRGRFCRHGQCLRPSKSGKPCVLRYEHIAFCVFSLDFSRSKSLDFRKQVLRTVCFYGTSKYFFEKNVVFFPFFDVLRWKKLRNRVIYTTCS